MSRPFEAGLMEHRQGTRFPVTVHTLFALAGRAQVKGILRDISVTGARIHTDRAPPALGIVDVLLPSDRVLRGQAWRKGLVVRRCAEGFALEWAMPLEQDELRCAWAADLGDTAGQALAHGP